MSRRGRHPLENPVAGALFVRQVTEVPPGRRSSASGRERDCDVELNRRSGRVTPTSHTITREGTGFSRADHGPVGHPAMAMLPPSTSCTRLPVRVHSRSNSRASFIRVFQTCGAARMLQASSETFLTQELLTLAN